MYSPIPISTIYAFLVYDLTWYRAMTSIFTCTKTHRVNNLFVILIYMLDICLTTRTQPLVTY